MVDEVFLTPVASGRERELLRVAAADGVRITLVTDRVAATLSDTVTPQGVFAVVRVADDDADTVLAGQPRLLAVLDGAADPGNAGTVIRSADAAGADAVILTGASVDPHNPKCIRASAGSIFHLPVLRVDDPVAAMNGARRSGLTVAATSLDPEADDLDSAGVQRLLTGRVAWVFGNEAHGLSQPVLAAADVRIRIPLYGRAESLNVAAAASICLYATARAQRAGA